VALGAGEAPIRTSLLDGTVVGFLSFQSVFHFLNRDDGRVIIDPVDLFEMAESLLHLFYSCQPVQSCSSHIISLDVKRDDGDGLALSRNHAKPRHKKEKTKDRMT
jgi:hypothetical protein